MKPTHSSFKLLFAPAVALLLWSAAVVASLVTLGGFPVAPGARPERVLQPERRAPDCAFQAQACPPAVRPERSAP